MATNLCSAPLEGDNLFIPCSEDETVTSRLDVRPETATASHLHSLVSPELAELIESYHVTFNTWKASEGESEQTKQLFDNHHALADVIAATPARSRTDAAAKLQLAACRADWTPERAEVDDLGPIAVNAAAAIQEAIAWLER